MLRYFLVGRTDSGCSFFEKLAEEQGIKVANDDVIVGYYMHEEIEKSQIIPIRPNGIEKGSVKICVKKRSQ